MITIDSLIGQMKSLFAIKTPVRFDTPEYIQFYNDLTHSEPVAQQALPVATISAKNSIVINININCTPADIDGLGEKISQLLYELSE